MTYQTHDALISGRRHHDHIWEYRLYVAVLLLVELPIAVSRSTADLFRPRGAAPKPRLVKSALSQARIIASTIMSA